MITVTEALEVTDDLVEAFARLIPQLSTTAPPGRQDLELIVVSPVSHLLVASDADGQIVGTLTLTMYQVPTGLQARIEDVVVDARIRRNGVAQLLTIKSIEMASQAGAEAIGLTSRPSREEANRLYQKLGFVQRDTRVYQMTLR